MADLRERHRLSAIDLPLRLLRDRDHAWVPDAAFPGNRIQPLPDGLLGTPVPVMQGWNWIGYLPQEPEEVTDALSQLHSLGFVVAGDAGGIGPGAAIPIGRWRSAGDSEA